MNSKPDGCVTFFEMPSVHDFASNFGFKKPRRGRPLKREKVELSIQNPAKTKFQTVVEQIAEPNARDGGDIILFFKNIVC